MALDEIERRSKVAGYDLLAPKEYLNNLDFVTLQCLDCGRIVKTQICNIQDKSKCICRKDKRIGPSELAVEEYLKDSKTKMAKDKNHYAEKHAIKIETFRRALNAKMGPPNVRKKVLNKFAWKSEEMLILNAEYPINGPVGVQDALSKNGYSRTPKAISRQAEILGLKSGSHRVTRR